MKKLSPAHEIGAGIFAGVADSLASHPIDQIKTQFQVSRDPNGSVFTALADQYAKGGIARLYRGILVACLRPQSLCIYTGNQWASREIGSLQSFTKAGGELTVLGSLVAGFLTGYPESVGVTPFEVVKVRMQSLEHVGRYNSTVECAREIVRCEGISALYTGFRATCARNCTFNGTYFMMIHATREELALPREPYTDFCLGCWAALVATVAKLPADISKSRIQNQLPPTAEEVEKYGAQRKYQNVVQCLRTVVREEGVMALYKGFG